MGCAKQNPDAFHTHGSEQAAQNTQSRPLPTEGHATRARGKARAFDARDLLQICSFRPLKGGHSNHTSFVERVGGIANVRLDRAVNIQNLKCSRGKPIELPERRLAGTRSAALVVLELQGNRLSSERVGAEWAVDAAKRVVGAQLIQA